MKRIGFRCHILPLLVPLVALVGCSGSNVTPAGGDDGGSTGSDGGGGDDVSSGDDANGGGGDGGARQLGTVADQSVACPSVAPPNTKCHTLTVSCPGIAPLTANVYVAEPSGTVKGTIVLHGGGGGTGYFGVPNLLGEYTAAGFRLVNMEWTSAWEIAGTGTPGIKTAACRPATVIKWAFDNPHGGHRDQGFCGQGQSGGSGVMSYALASYGLKDYLDYVMLTQGPPFGKMDCGCDPGASGCSPVPALCPEIASPALPLPPQLIDPWEGITSCGQTTISQSDVARLGADSVAADDGDFDYPKTQVSAWYCAQNPNGTTGGGAFYLARFSNKAQVYCSPNCSVEDIYNPQATLTNGTNVLQAMLQAMTGGCVPRHQ